MKQEAISKRESHKKEKFLIQRDAAWWLLCRDGVNCECGKEAKFTQSQLSQRMEQLTGIYVDRTVISDALKPFKKEEGEDYKE
jgi:hypothetical protein